MQDIPESTIKHTLLCSKCTLPLGDQLVKAMNGAFHPECFTCWDCGTPVASRYLPHPTEKGQPLCERDYFKRLDLVCAECDEPLRGTYIIALDKKYHTNHFTCNDCSTVFGTNDSYYEHESKVYCHYHYSTRFAVSCVSCEMSILKQYVEIERNDTVEHWHPECYMIQKFWSVKVAHPSKEMSVHNDISHYTPTELLAKQQEMEEKVFNIWSVLSAFEESSAVCISEMLLHVSNGAYIESICLSERFLVHVEALFAGIDKIQSIYLEYNQKEFKHTREAKMLCKKIINFFSLLSRTGDMEMKKLGITQELLSLVTGLAHFLKILIRLGLTTSLRLEIIVGKPVAVPHLLAKLMEIPGKERHSRDSQRLIKTKNNDYCHLCRYTVEDQCIVYGNDRWHMACFKCCQCHRVLSEDTSNATFDSNTGYIYCLSCLNISPEEATPFEHATKLSQYSYLLRVALSRLCNLLQISDSQLSSVDYSIKLKPNNLLKDMNSNIYLSPSSEKQPLIAEDKSMVCIPEMDGIPEMDEPDIISSAAPLDRKMSRSFKTAKRSTIIANADMLPLNTNQNMNPTMPPARMDSLQRQINKQKDLPQLPRGISRTPTRHRATRSVGLDDLPELAAAAVSSSTKTRDVSHHTTIPENIRITVGPSGNPRIYLSELSALQYMIVRYVAVVQIEPFVKSSFSSSELLNMIDIKKASIWGKFFSFKKQRSHFPKAKEDGTFGVPLDILTERTGVESNLGSGHFPVKLCSFIDDSITAMRQMDMTVEGIFRKNGNIRRLKELTDAFDKNPNDVDLTSESSVQVAALLKKFLRELPDPLLTHKLHSLFICAERIENLADRKRALHLACCMLPRCNREAMEVLFVFFRWVASFSHVTTDVGSRMDIPNLARVIAPNILVANSKDPLKDDSFASIRVVELLLESYEEFCMVPDDLGEFLQDPTLNEMEMSPKEFFKKLEQTVKHKNTPFNNSNATINNAHNQPTPANEPKLFDVTDGRQHPPTSIYSAQQFLPYTNNHPSSDYVPQQLNMRHHNLTPNAIPTPRRMDSHESFNSISYINQSSSINHYQNRYNPQQSPLCSSPTTPTG
ncbi:hypothetical protein BDB01DRAFT_830960 [Pilobolus umbonatus]|nr:hypothetical protein BDB01DRAFT_830960 [Pilobolus umbonatus]